LVVSFADVKRCLEGAFVELETQASDAVIPTNETVAPLNYDYNTNAATGYGAGGRGYQGQYL